MNNKMTTNSQLSTTEPKKKQKLSKQLEQKQNQRNITWRVFSGEGEEKNKSKKWKTYLNK